MYALNTLEKKAFVMTFKLSKGLIFIQIPASKYYGFGQNISKVSIPLKQIIGRDSLTPSTISANIMISDRILGDERWSVPPTNYCGDHMPAL